MANHHFPRPRILIVFIKLVFCTISLYAAPLNNGFTLAPAAKSSPAEKTAASQEARQQVLAAAGKYEHTPYRYGGLDQRGLDCSGLVYVSYRDALGVSVPRNTWSLYSWVEKVSIEDALPGDLLFFITTGNGSISHVGIFVGDGRFIHAASEGPVTGVMYSSLDERYWSRTFAGAGRALPEVKPGSAHPNNKNPATAQN
jgi:probable lipoprotein NlpC